MIDQSRHVEIDVTGFWQVRWVWSVTYKWKFLRDLTNELSYPKQAYYYLFIIFLLFVTSHDVMRTYTLWHTMEFSNENVINAVQNRPLLYVRSVHAILQTLLSLFVGSRTTSLHHTGPVTTCWMPLAVPAFRCISLSTFYVSACYWKTKLYWQQHNWLILHKCKQSERHHRPPCWHM